MRNDTSHRTSQENGASGSRRLVSRPDHRGRVIDVLPREAVDRVSDVVPRGDRAAPLDGEGDGRRDRGTVLQVVKEIVEVQRCEVADLIRRGALPGVYVHAPVGERDRPEQTTGDVPRID